MKVAIYECAKASIEFYIRIFIYIYIYIYILKQHFFFEKMKVFFDMLF
jgi:hypothetical protein